MKRIEKECNSCGYDYILEYELIDDEMVSEYCPFCGEMDDKNYLGDSDFAKNIYSEEYE